MKNDDLKSQKRRHILFGGFLLSAGALLAKFFKSASHQSRTGSDVVLNSVDTTVDNRLQFMKKSRDLNNYMDQLNFQKSDYNRVMGEKFPDLMPLFREKMGEEFWAQHESRIFNAFYEDTKKALTEEEAFLAIQFFESPAGQSYLRWKDLIHGRNSELYKAIQKLSDERGRFSKNIIDSASTKKA